MNFANVVRIFEYLNATPSTPVRKPVPYVPDSAPFSDEQRTWLNGFLAGLFADANCGEENRAPREKATALSLLVLYGSQTGSAERLARQIAGDSVKRGFVSRVLE